VEILDEQGFTQVIHFSRPVPKYAWINVVYELYDEEIFPSDGAGEELIIQNLLNAGLQTAISKDFLQQRFVGPIVSVPGVARATTLQIAVTDSPTDSPSYGTADISIGPTEVLEFDSARIFVTGS
jgi:hypothetical protein